MAGIGRARNLGNRIRAQAFRAYRICHQYHRSSASIQTISPHTTVQPALASHRPPGAAAGVVQVLAPVPAALPRLVAALVPVPALQPEILMIREILTIPEKILTEEIQALNRLTLHQDDAGVIA